MFGLAWVVAAYRYNKRVSSVPELWVRHDLKLHFQRQLKYGFE